MTLEHFRVSVYDLVHNVVHFGTKQSDISSPTGVKVATVALLGLLCGPGL